MIFTRGQRQPRVCVGTAKGGGGREAPRTWPCRARCLPRPSPCRLSPAMPAASHPRSPSPQAGRLRALWERPQAAHTQRSALPAHPRPPPSSLPLCCCSPPSPHRSPSPPPQGHRGHSPAAAAGGTDPRSHGILLQARRRSLPTRLPCGAQTCRSRQRLHPALQESHRSRKGPAALRSRALMAMAGEGLFRESLS